MIAVCLSVCDTLQLRLIAASLYVLIICLYIVVCCVYIGRLQSVDVGNASSHTGDTVVGKLGSQSVLCTAAGLNIRSDICQVLFIRTLL